MKTALVAALLLSAAAQALGQVRVVAHSRDFARKQAAIGSKLKYFEAIDNGVYKGSKPENDADYAFLQSLHIRYIVDLEVIPVLGFGERRHAKKYGITVVPGIMNASPFAPSEKHVDNILAILRDKRYRPVYFHCKLGRDRTAIIAALYKMYFLGFAPEDAEQYLREEGYGFKFGWVRSGLTRYLRNHPTPPPQFALASKKRIEVCASDLWPASERPMTPVRSFGQRRSLAAGTESCDP